jgi:alanine racemase
VASVPDQNPANIPSPAGSSPTVAIIDLGALAHNLAETRRCLSEMCGILAVVKADAYGHGAVAVSRALADMGVTRFGVASVREGAALREAGLHLPILVMGALLPEQIPGLLAYGLTPVVHDPAIADRLVELVRSRPEPYPVHVKVDTGMGRLGLDPKTLLSFLTSPCFKGPLRIEGLLTHLADADGQDSGYTRTQITRFRSVVEQVEAAGLSIPLIHAANSAALIGYPSAHFTLARPGLMLYGYHAAPSGSAAPDLKPVLSLKTHIVQLRTVASGDSISYNRTYVSRRPSQIAVLPVGYADGYNRALSNRGHVLIHGRQAAVVGRICMDMTMVDVTDIPGVRPGDEAVLIGRQGTAQITADDLAAQIGTISYEVLCAIGSRVPRRYS